MRINLIITDDPTYRRELHSAFTQTQIDDSPERYAEVIHDVAQDVEDGGQLSPTAWGVVVIDVADEQVAAAFERAQHFRCEPAA